MNSLYLFCFGLFVASATVWYRIVRRLQSNQPILPYAARPAEYPNAVATGFAVVWIGLQIFSAARMSFSDDVLSPPTLETVQTTCLFNLAVLLWFSLLLVDGRVQRLPVFGIHRRDWISQIVAGAVGFAASIFPVYAVLLVTLPLRTERNEHLLLRLLRDNSSASTVFWIGLSAVVLAPLVEELLFRVILQGWLAAQSSPRFAIGVSSLVFCLVHQFPDSVPLFPLALILGYVYFQRYSFVSAVVCHGLFNLANLLLALLT